jgi:hypothetical protein
MRPRPPFDPFALPTSHTRWNVSQNYQQSKPKVVSPFGSMPTDAAGKYLYNFAMPFARSIGRGNVREAGGQAGGVLSSLIPQFQGLGAETSGMARTAYGNYEASVDNFLKQLPGYSAALDTAYKGPGGVAAGDTAAQGYATQAAQEAFSPTASSALYNQFANQALGQARTSEAARGITDTGAAGAAEQQNILTPLARDFAAQRPAAEQAAISGLTGATTSRLANAGAYGTTGANLGAMAPAAQAQLFQAMPQLIQSLVTSLGLPASAVGSVISMLTGANQPLLQFADVTKPTVAQTSFGGGGSVGVSDERVKEDIVEDVPGLEALEHIAPISFTYKQQVEGQETGLPEGRHIGLSAQEVRAVLPHAVLEIPGAIGTTLAVDYRALVPVLVRAIQQLQARVIELEGR